VAVLLILVVLLSMGSGIYASASYFAQQANVTVTTTIYTTTTSWVTSTMWSTVTSVVYGDWTTVQYTTSTSTVTVGGGDSYTKLLLHMDGTSGSKTFLDSSLQSHTVTAYGGAQIDTAQSKFGGASGKFVASSSSYLSLADSTDWYFPGDFTIDFWARFNTIPSSKTGIFTQYASDYNQQQYTFNTGPSLSVELDYGGGTRFTMTRTISVTTGVWYHFAIVRSGNTWYMFQNGTQLGSTATSSAVQPDISAIAKIAGGPAGVGYFNGWIDEFRISNGIARWTSNFTPPTAPY
jgi:hypothetical protein